MQHSSWAWKPMTMDLSNCLLEIWISQLLLNCLNNSLSTVRVCHFWTVSCRFFAIPVGTKDIVLSLSKPWRTPCLSLKSWMALCWIVVLYEWGQYNQSIPQKHSSNKKQLNWLLKLPRRSTQMSMIQMRFRLRPSLRMTLATLLSQNRLRKTLYRKSWRRTVPKRKTQQQQ